MAIRWMTRNALLAGMYVVLTLTPPLNTLSFYAIQFRLSEALLIFVWFRKDYTWGLIIGTLIANLLGPLGGGFAIFDAFIGSVVTFVALLWMQSIKPKPLGLLGPVLLNSLYLALFLPFALNLPFTLSVIGVTALTVALGESVVVYGLGLPLYWFILRQPNLLPLITKD